MRNKLLWTFFFWSTSAAAQERIDTDRPDQTESAVLVPKKYFQGEFGFGKEHFEDHSYSVSHPAFLFRYGLGKRIELRLASEWKSDYVSLLPGPTAPGSLAPVEIGTKIALFEEKRLRPKTSLIIHFGKPVNTSGTGGGGFYPSFRFTSQHTLTPALAIGYNLGWLSDEDGKSLLYTFAPGMNMGKRWYGYAEAFGFYRTSSRSGGATGWINALDAGLAYYASKDFKLDFSSGIGIGRNPMKNYVAFGLSFRVPLGRQHE